MKYLAALLLALLVACGGGGGSVTDQLPSVPPPAPRHDLLVGYYGTTPDYVGELATHTNLFWGADFHGGQLEGVGLARGFGLKAVVMLGMCQIPLPVAESEARSRLKPYHDGGHLVNVVGVVWCDEPNTGRSGAWTDAAAQGMHAAVKRAMASYPELNAKLIVIYQCGSYPGASNADAVGCDFYNAGSNVWARYYADLEQAAPQAVLVLVNAGAEPYKQPPQPMLDYANSHPKVWMAVSFIFQTETDGNTYKGIRDNGLGPAYCAAYQVITQKTAACT